MAKENWFKPFLLALLGLLVIAGLIAGSYFLGQKGFRVEIVNQAESSPEATISSETLLEADETIDWEVYTDLQYSYQFKHPQGWFFNQKIVSDETKPLYVIRGSIQSQEINDYFISVKVWDNPDKASLTTWLQFMKDSKALSLPAEDLTLVPNKRVNGEPAFRIWSDPLTRGREPGKCFQACPILSVYFTHQDKAYLVEHTYLREVDEASQVLFDLFLSTFKFLD